MKNSSWSDFTQDQIKLMEQMAMDKLDAACSKPPPPMSGFTPGQLQLAQAMASIQWKQALPEQMPPFYGGQSPVSGLVESNKLTPSDVKKAVKYLKQASDYSAVDWITTNYEPDEPKKGSKPWYPGGPLCPDELAKLLRCIPRLCKIEVSYSGFDMVTISHTIPAHERTYKIERPKPDFWSSIDDPKNQGEDTVIVEKFPEYRQTTQVGMDLIDRTHDPRIIARHLIERLGHQIAKDQRFHG